MCLILLQITDFSYYSVRFDIQCSSRFISSVCIMAAEICHQRLFPVYLPGGAMVVVLQMLQQYHICEHTPPLTFTSWLIHIYISDVSQKAFVRCEPRATMTRGLLVILLINSAIYEFSNLTEALIQSDLKCSCSRMSIGQVWTLDIGPCRNQVHHTILQSSQCEVGTVFCDDLLQENRVHLVRVPGFTWFG